MRVKSAFRAKPNVQKNSRDAGSQGDRGADFRALIEAIKDEGRAYRNEEQREDSGKSIREWITIFLIFSTLIAVCYQVYEMIKVYEPIKEQAEASQRAADATTRAADAATKQSEIATAQSEKSDNALVQSQRAWVGPSLARLEGSIELGKSVDIQINYSNSGKEPALNFVYVADMFLSSAEDDANGVTSAKVDAYYKGCKEAKTLRAGSVLFPSASNILTATSKDGLVDQDAIDGKKSIVISGCFLYRSFEVVRHTYFCYFYTAKKTKPDNLNICVNGAGAD